MSRNVIKAFLIVSLLVGTSIAWARGDGTLPLRLRGGDGTLPLRFSGDALSLAGNPQRRLQTEMTISAATRQALPLAQQNRVSCQQASADVTRHSAAGVVLIDGVGYSIVGICYNQVDQTMEVVAERHLSGNVIERSFAVSQLREAQPSSLSGRLTVNGSASQAGRYILDLQGF